MPLYKLLVSNYEDSLYEIQQKNNDKRKVIFPSTFFFFPFFGGKLLVPLNLISFLLCNNIFTEC